MSDVRTTDRFCDTSGAGQYLGLSPRTMEKMRVRGDGPPFRKHGNRVVYDIDDLDAWSEDRRRTSTSDPRGVENPLRQNGAR